MQKIKIEFECTKDEARTIGYALAREAKSFRGAATTTTEDVGLDVVTAWAANAALLDRIVNEISAKTR